MNSLINAIGHRPFFKSQKQSETRPVSPSQNADVGAPKVITPHHTVISLNDISFTTECAPPPLPTSNLHTAPSPTDIAGGIQSATGNDTTPKMSLFSSANSRAKIHPFPENLTKTNSSANEKPALEIKQKPTEKAAPSKRGKTVKTPLSLAHIRLSRRTGETPIQIRDRLDTLMHGHQNDS